MPPDIAHTKEIILRGTYLSMAADVEWIMSMLLSQIFAGKEHELINKNGDELDKFTLEDKLSFVELGFIRYHNDLWSKYNPEFSNLHELRRMRNDYGHGKIDFIAGSQEEFKITLLKIDPKTGHLQNKKYKFTEAIKELDNYRISVMEFIKRIGDAAEIKIVNTP